MSLVHQLPKRISVRTTHSSPEGLAVILLFKMKSKNDFSYIVFLDSNGIAEVFREDILKHFDEQRNVFIMDYIDPRIGFTGEMSAHILSSSELKGALSAFQMFRDKLWYPSKYEERLNKAIAQGQDSGGFKVELQSTQ